MHIQWYATVFRAEMFVDAVSEFAAPASLRYDAKRYSVQRSQDDHYKILQQVWFESKDDWYRYWEGPGDARVPRSLLGQVPGPDHLHLARRVRRRRCGAGSGHARGARSRAAARADRRRLNRRYAPAGTRPARAARRPSSVRQQSTVIASVGAPSPKALPAAPLPAEPMI